MDEREQQRKIRHRLAILRHAEEVTGNVAATCRYYGISRPAFYMWLRRYEEHGEAACGTGLERPRTQPERDPRRGRRQDHLPAPELPLRAAEDLDVPQALPRRRDQPLGRVADPQAAGHEPAAGSQRYKRHKRPLEALREAAARPPGADRREVHRAARRVPQASTTSSPPSTTAPGSGSCGSTTATTRRPRSSSSTTSSRSSRSGSRSSRPTTAPSSRPPSTGTSSTAASATSTSSRPHPRLNGKVERSHRIDAEEFYRLLDGVVIDDTELFNDKLQEWEDFYNFHRPHGGLGGQTPYVRMRISWPATRRMTRQPL